MLELFLSFLEPSNILIAVLASIYGIVIGVIPGLGPTLGLALLIPIIIFMPMVSALTILGATFGAAIYGGCISAILINSPGTPGSVATSFDGYPLALQGRGAYAVGAATSASGIGSILGILFLIFLGPPIAYFSLRFGPAENFVLAILGLAFIARTIEGSFLKGIMAAVLGLFLSTVGQDIVLGYSRFSFGISYFEDGIKFIPAIIGLFAVSQALTLAEEGGTISKTGKVNTKEILTGAFESIRYWKTTLRSSIIGIGLGILPGLGISTANILAYTEEKRNSKDGDTFGKGNIRGVIAPESANNAVMGGSLIPAFTLGIPGGSAAAVFLVALNFLGFQPGFRLYTVNADILYGLIIAMLIGTVIFVVVGLISMNVLIRLTILPNEYLVPGILVMCVLGAYASRYNMGDAWLCLAMGVLGYFFTKIKFPIVPLVIALVLGPIVEQSFIRAMLTSNWSLMIFARSPICVVVLLLTLLVLIEPVIKHFLKKKKAINAS
ncbi:MAG: tripartite tricarboxylate transporter permease [Peptostreptococcales bacterium]